MRTYTAIPPTDTLTDQQFPVFSRDLFLQIAQAAIDSQEYRFAQEVILGWLAAYPGDLPASLIYAEALLGNQRTRQAVRVLEGLCLVDPEFSQAVADLILARSSDGAGTKSPADADPERSAFPAALLVEWAEALSDRQQKAPASDTQAWGQPLASARRQIEEGAFEAAQVSLLPVIGQDPASPLPAVIHLHLMARSGAAPAPAIQSLAEHYLRRWPDCLALKLYSAEALLESGDTARGVALLHEAARRDITGQVATRLWGANHRYRSLWPAHLELEFRWIVPAAVAARIGWNRLPAGELVFVSPEPQSEPPLASVAAAAVATQNNLEDELPAPKGIDIEILSVQQALFMVADRLNRPEYKSLDTRYPVYVILTVQQALEAQYGPAGAAQIINEASSLAIKIQAHAARHADFRWGARLYLPDQPVDKSASAADAADPRTIKKAILRLDQELATHGERIGALLILGGPEIVPFHALPNPVDDPDEQVASDNPYACRGGNYFLPEWPVGRLVGGAGKDPALLIAQIQRLGKTYLDPNQPRRGFRQMLRRISAAIRPSGKAIHGGFGYTAAVWKQASVSVFKPIGRGGNLHTSPPFGLSNPSGDKKRGKGIPMPRGTFAYFNLHGLVDAGEWFGQRDYQDNDSYPDYPVALRPEDVLNLAQTPARQNTPRLPRVVFSEACYGANIQDKQVNQALSLAFLQAGSEAVVGSTAMSYGSISAPLIAADFLGYTFWNGVQSGLPVGEALRQAKLRLAQEMNTRQGFLDGEDQKTLLSFVLYGDPLLQIVPNPTGRKSITRWQAAPPIEINTICDRACQYATEAALPEGTLQAVQKVVARRLPGMQGATMTVAEARTVCTGNDHNCPNRRLCEHSPSGCTPNRRMVTLSKSFRRQERSQTHIARLTLDPDGNIVKLVVSR
jgi:hypothetical protein